jgi:hypothetical protein
MPKRAQLISMAVSPYAIDLPQPVVRYRGFVLIPQRDLSWLVRPERSTMAMLPFRAPASSVADVRALLDWRLSGGGCRGLLG